MRHWHLISYDIHHPARLRRTHRALRKQATALLESLFVFEGTVQELESLRQLITRETRMEDVVWYYTLRMDRPLQRWGKVHAPRAV